MFPHYAAMFNKSLVHNEDGIVSRYGFEAMYKAVNKSPCYFNDIIYGGDLKLVEPASVYSDDFIGPYKSTTKLRHVPSFQSSETAGEMVELYNMSLLRDVHFSDYESNIEVLQACEDLNVLSCFKGPKKDGLVTPKTLFRGNSIGDLKGPYVSQFLYRDFHISSKLIKQTYGYAPEDIDFMTTYESALSVQNGIVTEQAPDFVGERYITTLRDGATYVHFDAPDTSTLNAMNVLYDLGCPISSSLTFPNQDYFVDIGRPDVADLITLANTQTRLHIYLFLCRTSYMIKSSMVRKVILSGSLLVQVKL